MGTVTYCRLTAEPHGSRISTMKLNRRQVLALAGRTGRDPKTVMNVLAGRGRAAIAREIYVAALALGIELDMGLSPALASTGTDNFTGITKREV